MPEYTCLGNDCQGSHCLGRHCPCFYCRGSHPPTLRPCRLPPSAAPRRPGALAAAAAAQRPRARRPAALRAALPRAHRRGRRSSSSSPRSRTLVFPVALQVADRPGLRRRRSGRARDGAARALLRPVRGRRRARRVLGGALLHGELARRARHRRPAQRRLRARRPAEPRVLRDDADRRGAVAPDRPTRRWSRRSSARACRWACATP